MTFTLLVWADHHGGRPSAGVWNSGTGILAGVGRNSWLEKMRTTSPSAVARVAAADRRRPHQRRRGQGGTGRGRRSKSIDHLARLLSGQKERKASAAADHARIGAAGTSAPSPSRAASVVAVGPRATLCAHPPTPKSPARQRGDDPGRMEWHPRRTQPLHPSRSKSNARWCGGVVRSSSSSSRRRLRAASHMLLDLHILERCGLCVRESGCWVTDLLMSDRDELAIDILYEFDFCGVADGITK